MSDSLTGAVIRRNIIGIAESRGIVPSELYNAIGWSRVRFWGQFSASANGPRLDFVQRMAERLEVPMWRLLTREGEARPKIGSKYQRGDPGTVRHFIRLNASQFIQTCEIPTEPRARELPVNLLVRQNVAIGCWQQWISEVTLFRDRLKIQRGTWFSWFRRTTGIAMVDLWRIADALEMQPWELVHEVNTEPG